MNSLYSGHLRDQAHLIRKSSPYYSDIIRTTTLSEAGVIGVPVYIGVASGFQAKRGQLADLFGFTEYSYSTLVCYTIVPDIG